MSFNNLADYKKGDIFIQTVTKTSFYTQTIHATRQTWTHTHKDKKSQQHKSNRTTVIFFWFGGGGGWTNSTGDSRGGPPPPLHSKRDLKLKASYFGAHRIQSAPALARSCRWSQSCHGRRCGRCSASPWCTSTRRRTRWSWPRPCSPDQTWLWERARESERDRRSYITSSIA